MISEAAVLRYAAGTQGRRRLFGSYVEFIGVNTKLTKRLQNQQRTRLVKQDLEERVKKEMLDAIVAMTLLDTSGLKRNIDVIKAGTKDSALSACQIAIVRCDWPRDVCFHRYT